MKTDLYKGRNVLFLDLETSPDNGWFWRPGYKVSLSHDNIQEERQIILASYAWNNEKPKTVKWVKDKSSKNKYIQWSDLPIVEKLSQQIDKADLIVGQNHKSFDIPWLRGRAMKQGIKIPTNIPLFDTLKETRKHFNLNSYRLDYLSKLYLGEGKKETGGFGLWKECIAGSRAAMKTMQVYCEGDVSILRDYFELLSDYVPSLQHMGVSLGHAKYTCNICGTHEIRLKKAYVSKSGTTSYGMVCKKDHHYSITEPLYFKWLAERD